MDNLKAKMYNRRMFIKPKILSKIIFVLVFCGFVLPIKAPVSSAQAKLCCKSKAHCLMGGASEAKISVMGKSEGAEMIACCQDDCLSCSETSVLHPRNENSSQNLGMSPTWASVNSIVVSDSLYNTGPPDWRALKSRSTNFSHSSPIFLLNSVFLI